MASREQRSNKEKKKPKQDKNKKDVQKSSPFAAATPKGNTPQPQTFKK